MILRRNLVNYPRRQWHLPVSAASQQTNRTMSDSSSSWSKKQIEKIEQKFSDDPSANVKSDEELQQMWREMESRVVKRRPRTIRETGGKTGRVNVRKTDEEMWLNEGLYEEDDGAKKSK